MKKIYLKLVLLAAPDASFTERLKYLWDVLLHLAPVVFVLDMVNWWFKENSQFGSFMCIALLINLVVGTYYHLKKGTFSINKFITRNMEMLGVLVIVYVMLEMLRYTAGNNIAGELFKVTIQMVTLLYPTSKVLKNIFIITEGKYPPEFLMTKLYNLEKNGDLNDFFQNKKDAD